MNTLDLLTRLKARYDGASDYAIAKKLGVRPQTVYQWKSGKTGMADDVAIRACELLGLDPVTVLLDLHIEREKGNAASRVWRDMRDRLQMAAALAVVGFVGYWGGAVVGVPLV